MRQTRHSTRTLVSIFIFVGLVWLASCAPAKFEQNNSFNLTWPPQDDNRIVSDSSALIYGKDYGSSGGNVAVSGTAVNIDSGADFSWTMYSVGGLAGDVSISSLQVDATVTQAGTEQNTAVWIGLSNYTHNRWEWHKLDPTQASNTHTYDTEDYISPGYRTYVVTLVYGGGSALVSQLQVNVQGDTTLMAPENLRATADVGQITLDWDDVIGADKYNIYRSLEPNFPTPVLINTVDVTDSTFVDNTVVQHKMYYYKVRAYRFVESGDSNMVDIYSPMVDLPLAENVRIIDRTDTQIQFAWDAAVNPANGWYVYYSDVANFSLNTLSGQFSLPAYMRDTWLEDLDPTKTYDFRIAPRQSSSLGRMTDDLGGRVKGYWTWNESQLAEGSGPISLAMHDTRMDALYMSGTAIKMAEYDTGAWNLYDTPLDSNVDIVKNPGDGGFNYYLSSGYANGNHVLLGHTQNSDDLYGAVGNPGNWTTKRYSGDGNTASGHNQSGEFCKVACWAGGYAVLDFQAVGTKGELYTFDWSNALQDTFDFTTSTPAMWSMVHDGSKLNMVYWNATTNKFMQYNSTSGSAVDAGTTGQYNDLQIVDGNLMTPAENVTGDLVAMTYNGAGWSSAGVADEAAVQVGIDSKLASDGGTGAAMAYRSSAYPRVWYFVIFDGTTWKTPQKLAIGNVMFTDDLDMTWCDGKAWLMYRDLRRLNKIFVAWGEPPA